MSYAGFTNRETWAVHHWMVSEPDYLRAVREVIACCPPDNLEFTVLAVLRLMMGESPYIRADIGDIDRVNLPEVIAKIQELDPEGGGQK